MSSSDKKVSGEAQDERQNDSVYDFLYYDRQRVGAFLAQFDDSGHLQRITQSESASKDSGRGLKIGAGASYLGTGGNLNFERTPGLHGAEGTERVYDPLWSNALTFLDYLETANLICLDITKGHLGQFVLASGSLSVLNAALLTPLWKSSSLVRIVESWAKTQTTPQGQKDKDAERRGKLAMEILPSMPHFAQCKVKGDNFVVWSTLAPEGMVGTVSDLSLKHGTDIPGTWSILGVLDAVPSPIPTPMAFPNNPGASQPFDSLIRNFSVLARSALGRPADAYGATALLLFRKVSSGGN
jgi:hypothetical protein